MGSFDHSLAAGKVAMRTGKLSTCALPYGINTPGAITKLFSIIAVVVAREKSKGASSLEAAEEAWKVAVACNFVSGLFELIGAFFAPLTTLSFQERRKKKEERRKKKKKEEEERRRKKKKEEERRKKKKKEERRKKKEERRKKKEERRKKKEERRKKKEKE